MKWHDMRGQDRTEHRHDMTWHWHNIPQHNIHPSVRPSIHPYLHTSILTYIIHPIMHPYIHTYIHPYVQYSITCVGFLPSQQQWNNQGSGDSNPGWFPSSVVFRTTQCSSDKIMYIIYIYIFFIGSATHMFIKDSCLLWHCLRLRVSLVFALRETLFAVFHKIGKTTSQLVQGFLPSTVLAPVVLYSFVFWIYLLASMGRLDLLLCVNRLQWY